jgi:hypothetical protein
MPGAFAVGRDGGRFGASVIFLFEDHPRALPSRELSGRRFWRRGEPINTVVGGPTRRLDGFGGPPRRRRAGGAGKGLQSRDPGGNRRRMQVLSKN